jgi:hypothetical protein
VDVDASGVFLAASTSLGSLIDTYVGTEPGLDQCRFSELPLDAFTAGGFQTLDAGNALTLQSSAGASAQLPKDADAAAFGYVIYGTEDGQLGSGFYQSGATYTFQGGGGPQLGPFSVSVTAPPPLNLTQPPLSEGSTHDAAQNLNVAWQGNNGVGEVAVILSGTDLVAVYQIWCRFVDDGSGSVPANQLTQLRDSVSSLQPPPGLELPPGFELPGFGASVGFGAYRERHTLFNTSGGELSYGVASVEAAASTSLLLE